MRIRNFYVALLIALLLLTVSGCKPEVHAEFTKIINQEDIPEKVWQNILELNTSRDLQHGVWFFPAGEFYGTENSHIMICGGRDYVNGYDADITNIVVRIEDTPAVGQRASAWMSPEFSETVSAESTAYSDGMEYPIVVFRIDSYFGPKDRVGNPSDADGQLALQLTHPNPCEYLKLERTEDVPPFIMDRLQNLEVRRGSWVFKVPNDKGEDVLYYLICGGEQYSNSYNADTVKVKYTPGSRNQVRSGSIWYDAFFTPYITENSDAPTTPYSEGLDYPVVLFCIDTGFGDHDKVIEVVTDDLEVLEVIEVIE